MLAELDATMIGQALTNLIKNAGEAIETLQEKHPEVDVDPQVRVALAVDGDTAIITIADNGIGLPEDRARLFEPYVTTREKGTGLGLPIVKKIIEEHGGTLTLDDAALSMPGRASRRDGGDPKSACRLQEAERAAAENEGVTKDKRMRST